MGKLDGKVALITGATSGMGKGTSFLFAQEGAKVILVGRDLERGATIKEEIISRGGTAKFYACDLSCEIDIKKMYEKVKCDFKAIDILFNNAGIWKTYSLDEITEATLWDSMKTNFGSTVFMSKYFIPLMNENSCILNNASIGGLESFTSGAKSYVYHSSKSSIVKFSKLLAKNYAPKIRVNVICPGIISTEIYINPDLSRFNSQIPMGYVAEVDEVAKAALFLCSDDAKYITGAVLTVDGGMSLT